jgi:hypothetical protein
MNRLLPIEHLGLALCLSLGTLVGCGGSGGAVVPPTISDLVITPSTATVGTTTDFTGTLTLSDPEGDESTIDATITLPGGQSQTLPPSALQGVSGQKIAAVDVVLAFSPPTAGNYVVSVVVTDADGVASNALTATITAQ